MRLIIGMEKYSGIFKVILISVFKVVAIMWKTEILFDVGGLGTQVVVHIQSDQNILTINYQYYVN